MNVFRVPTPAAEPIAINLRKPFAPTAVGSKPPTPHLGTSRPKRVRRVACQAGSGDDGAAPGDGASKIESEIIEPDNLFLLKLLGLSTGGALLVKYGSLLIDAPFTPNGPLALGMIYGPTLIFMISLALRPSEAKS